jgi:hypothetical protein
MLSARTMGAPALMFAVIDPEGNVRAVERDPARAINVAGTTAPNVQFEGDVAERTGSLAGLGQVSPERMPEIALQNSGLPRLRMSEVMLISLEQAHAVLLPFFPRSKTRGGRVVPVRSHETAKKMSQVLLGQNYKTAKETPEDPSDVQGLSLMPYFMAERSSKHRLPMRGLGLCVGSSGACRTGCLVYSGHNTIDLYNIAVKLARTEALELHPREFCRMLVEAVRWNIARAAKGKAELFVRLNVFSDVPWELVFPDLFTEFSSTRFYDYTKVPGRQVPRNYDLTFSWSGSNESYVRSELSSKRRIAVVFIPPGPIIQLWRRAPLHDKVTKLRGMGLPKKFLDLKVIDGDVSDVRPRDPSPSIVGLRWKLPHGQDRALEKAEARSFVVPVAEVEGVLVASHASRHQVALDDDGEID